MAAETEAAAGNATINYEAASTAVLAAVDAGALAAAPEAGESGHGYDSGGVDVGSGNADCSDDSDGKGNGDSGGGESGDDDDSNRYSAGGGDDDNGDGVWRRTESGGRLRRRAVAAADCRRCGGSGLQR